jgi:uroporphyrinogen decarboxylase
MNARERFTAVMTFQPVDRCLFTPYFGPWESTVRRWRGEGLGDRHWAEPFGFDVANEHTSEFIMAPVKTFVYPFYEQQVLREEPGRSLIRDRNGVTKYVRTDGESMARYDAWPVRDRASWDAFKQHLDPETPGRFPADWAARIDGYRRRDYVMGVGDSPVGLFSGIREFMGAENVLMACALEPDWVRDMAEHLADFWGRLFAKVAADVPLDYVYLWELICNNKGPMISPEMFRSLFLPAYKKLIGRCKAAGIPRVLMDMQGNIHQMLPLMLEAGVDGTMPLEVRSGMDVVQVRQAYPRLLLIGGMERMALVRGRDAIDAELVRVAPLVPQGG